MIEVINKLDFYDYIKARAILNKSDFSSKEIELDIAIEKHKKHRITYFKWLDKLK